MEAKKKSKSSKKNKVSKGRKSVKIVDENNNRSSNLHSNNLKNSSKSLNDITKISTFNDNNSIQYKNEKELLDVNNLNKEELQLKRKDYNGIEINKLNIKNFHICFLDRFGKPLTEIINVQSYKKINHLLYIGFADKKLNHSEQNNDNEKTHIKNSNPINYIRRKEQFEFESIDNDKAVCAACKIF